MNLSLIGLGFLFGYIVLVGAASFLETFIRFWRIALIAKVSRLVIR